VTQYARIAILCHLLSGVQARESLASIIIIFSQNHKSLITITMIMTTAQLLTLCVFTTCCLLTCNGDFFNDMPAKGCSICNDDELLNSKHVIVVGVHSGKTCQEVDDEASQITSESGDIFLSICFQDYQDKYKEDCCTDVATIDSSTTMLQSGVDNMFDKSSTSDTDPLLASETELSEGYEMFGVRKEDPWRSTLPSGAANLWPFGYLALLFVIMIALVPAHFL